ncbi:MULTISPECIES: hypothetical protein [unclassified Frankia]|uniref:hypothetical protein n=1 Tax=unclassified Frankia TaxID=2632575 RepID=UPI004043B805
MTTLLDANVLIALIVSDHVHHDAAETWLADTAASFATCPITEVDRGNDRVRLISPDGQCGRGGSVAPAAAVMRHR